MKRFIPLLCCLCLILGLMPQTASAAVPWLSGVSIEADGGILMDADTGTILYGKNMDQPYYPASITKILTALIVLERCSLDEMVEFSYDDVYNVEAGSSSAGIDEGDVLTVRDCLYALLLASANESANALACHISGSREAFADLMNEKAASLGCTGSHFANPSGLNDENHYTTAHDMALITREAIKNPVFLEINGTRSYQLAPTKRSPEGGYVANHHRMLNKNESVYYPGAFAGKTGYTSLAGNTLVTCAKRNDMTLIAVVLNGHQSHYSDTKALFDFGFNNFQSLRVSDYETTYQSIENDMTIGGMTAQDAVSLTLDPQGRVVIPKDGTFGDLTSVLTYDLDSQAPEGAVAAVQYAYEDHSAGFVYLMASGFSSSVQGSVSGTSQGTQGDSAALQPEPAALSAQGEQALQDTQPAQEAQNAAVSHAGNGAAETSLENASLPSSAETPAEDKRSPEGTATDIRIPANLWTVLGILFSLSLIISIVAAVRVHMRRKQERDRLPRTTRRRERLEDIGFSSSDFDQLVAQRRLQSASSRRPRRRPRRRRDKKSIFR